MRPSFHGFLRTTRATAAMEFAIVLPVMLLFMSGIVEFGRYLQVYDGVNRLASRYALSWADCSDNPAGACQTELASYTSSFAMTNMAPQLRNPITLRMIEVSISGSTPTVIYASPTGATLTAAELATALSAINNGQTGVVVTVTYVHSLLFFAPLMTKYLGNYVGPTHPISYTIAQLKS